MARLRLAHDSEAAKLLNDPANDVFVYRTNKPVIGFMLVMGALFTIGAIAWAALHGFRGTDNLVVIAIFSVASFYFGARALHWRHFADANRIAVHPERLVFGSDKRAWSIGWDLLDTQSVGLEEIELSKVTAKLGVRVAKEELDILLFSTLVHLAELERFIGTVLEHVALVDSDDDE